MTYPVAVCYAPRMSNPLTARVQVNLAPHEKVRLVQRARDEKRTVANVARLAVLSYLDGGKAK